MFSCKRCNYSTFAKGDLKKHLNRKIPCKPVLTDIEVTILHPDFFVPDERDKSYICDFCQKGLTSRSGKSQHRKICPAKILHDEQQNQMVQQLEEQKKLLEEKDKLIEEQKKQLEAVNNSGNTINSHNTINNINNIKVYMLGTEKLDFLSEEPNYKAFMTRCLRNTTNGYLQLMNRIYFNDLHPENMNIKKISRNNGRLEYFDGIKWVSVSADKVLEQIISQLNMAFDEFFEWIEENGEQRITHEIVKNFMDDVGRSLNMDFSYYKYDVGHDNCDKKTTEKKKKHIEGEFIENIFNKGAGIIGLQKGF